MAMASLEECEKALHRLADRLAAADPAVRRRAGLDRTISCTLRDLGAVFGGRLRDGELIDITPVERGEAQVRMTMTSDDLVKLVDGQLNMGAAFATGRVRIDASMRDLIRLRSIF